MPLMSAIPALRVRAVLRGAGRPPSAGTSCPPSLMPLLLALRCGERGRGGNSGACDFIARCAETLLVVGMGPRRPVAPLRNCLGAPSCAPLRGLAVLYFPKQKLLLPTYSASKESVQLSSPPPYLVLQRWPETLLLLRAPPGFGCLAAPACWERTRPPQAGRTQAWSLERPSAALGSRLLSSSGF